MTPSVIAGTSRVKGDSITNKRATKSMDRSAGCTEFDPDQGRRYHRSSGRRNELSLGQPRSPTKHSAAFGGNSGL